MSSASTSAEAYGLPPHAPPFLGEERILLESSRFAIFFTTPMDVATQEELVDCINKSGSEDANHSKLAPDPDFSDRSLRDVYDHFMKLREQDESIQPLYFIVADKSNHEEDGILGVCLDCAHDGSNKISVARCAVDRADGWGADFYYGFGTWEEMREEEGVEFGSSEVDPEDEAEVGDEGGGIGRLRGMYGVYSLVSSDVNVIVLLGSKWQEGNQDECRIQLLGNVHASQDPWMEISKEHPGHAALRQRIHRQIVVVVEKEDLDAPNAVAISQLESDRRPKALARVSANTAITEADATVKRLKLWNPWEPASYRTLM